MLGCTLYETQIAGNVTANLVKIVSVNLTGEISLPVGLKLYDPLVALLYSS